MENYEKKASENLLALKRKNENNMTGNMIIAILFSLTCLIGIIVCLICNLAISGNLSWSLIPASSIVFAWVLSFPGIILGKRGIIISLISLSVFILPYLFLLSNILKTKEIFSIGAVMAIVSIVFLWIIAGVFKYMGKERGGTEYTLQSIKTWAAVPLMFLL